MSETNEFIASIEKQLREITQGKWNGSRRHPTSAIAYVDDELGDEIAVLYDLGYKSPYEANAQFIALAPDTVRKLTEMLKVAMTGLEHIDNECRKERIAWGIASDAIGDVHDIAAGGEK